MLDLSSILNQFLFGWIFDSIFPSDNKNRLGCSIFILFILLTIFLWLTWPSNVKWLAIEDNDAINNIEILQINGADYSEKIIKHTEKTNAKRYYMVPGITFNNNDEIMVQVDGNKHYHIADHFWYSSITIQISNGIISFEY